MSAKIHKKIRKAINSDIGLDAAKSRLIAQLNYAEYLKVKERALIAHICAVLALLPVALILRSIWIMFYT